MILNEGKIVVASSDGYRDIEVQKLRNKKEENKQIKEGKVPAAFTDNRQNRRK